MIIFQALFTFFLQLSYLGGFICRMKAQNKTGSGKADKKGIFSGLVSKVIGKNRNRIIFIVYAVP